MIYGIGIDLAEIPRIERAAQKNPRFVDKVLTPAEKTVWQQYSGARQQEYLAGRFSAKEAFSKAWGTGIGKLSFQDLSILDTAQGRPQVVQQIFPGQVFISISHTQQYVVTQVLLETNGKE